MISILFALGGLWAVITGKLPVWLYGGRDYQVTGTGARLLGLALVAPMPFSYVVATILVAMGVSDQQVENYAKLVQLVGVGLAAIAVIVISRRIRRRTDGMPLTEADRRFSLGQYWRSRNWVFKAFVFILLFFFVGVPVLAFGVMLLGG